MLSTVLQKGAIYALLVVSMNLLNGFTGLFSLGQAGFMLLGAYTYAIPVSYTHLDVYKRQLLDHQRPGGDAVSHRNRGGRHYDRLPAPFERGLDVYKRQVLRQLFVGIAGEDLDVFSVDTFHGFSTPY